MNDDLAAGPDEALADRLDAEAVARDAEIRGLLTELEDAELDAIESVGLP